MGGIICASIICRRISIVTGASVYTAGTGGIPFVVVVDEVSTTLLVFLDDEETDSNAFRGHLLPIDGTVVGIIGPLREDGTVGFVNDDDDEEEEDFVGSLLL